MDSEYENCICYGFVVGSGLVQFYCAIADEIPLNKHG